MNETQGKDNGSVRIRLAALGFTLLLAFAAIVFAASIAQGNESTSGDSITAYPTNENVQSYGSCANASTPAEEPDLIRVEADNGKVGYCYRNALDPSPTHSRAEGEALMEESMRGREIPVYEVDGVTKIGVFTEGGPGSAVTTQKADGTIVEKVSNDNGTITTTITETDGTVTKTTE